MTGKKHIRVKNSRVAHSKNFVPGKDYIVMWHTQFSGFGRKRIFAHNAKEAIAKCKKELGKKHIEAVKAKKFSAIISGI